MTPHDSTGASDPIDGKLPTDGTGGTGSASMSAPFTTAVPSPAFTIVMPPSE